MENSILITKINNYLARYRLFVEQENRANRYNINIRAESFFIPLLKILFDCPDLENLNIQDKNFPGLDLGDHKRKVAVQITSDKSSKKIEKTLQTFYVYKLYKEYDRLIFFILLDKQKTYSSKKITNLIKTIRKKIGLFSLMLTRKL